MRSLMKALKLIIPCALICAAKEAKEVESSFNGPKIRVIITNKIGDDVDLIVHCKSGDDDLGVHVLKNGEDYHFKFRPNYLWNTLFFCGCTSIKGHVVFDAYKQVYDQLHCGTMCQWTADKEGVHGGKGLEGIEFKWQKN